jgi:hypothetical protein
MKREVAAFAGAVVAAEGAAAAAGGAAAAPGAAGRRRPGRPGTTCLRPGSQCSKNQLLHEFDKDMHAAGTASRAASITGQIEVSSKSPHIRKYAITWLNVQHVVRTCAYLD